MGLFQKKAPFGGCPYFPYFRDLGTWSNDVEGGSWTLYLHRTSAEYFGFRTNASFRRFADIGGDSTSDERVAAQGQRTHIQFAVFLGPDVWFLQIVGIDGPKFLSERLDAYWRNVLHADMKFDFKMKRSDSEFENLPVRSVF